MTAFIRRWGLILLALAAARPAAGQSYVAFEDDWRRIVESLRFSLGPVKIDPVFSLRRVGYDTNIFYEDRDVGDYTGVASLDVTAYLPVRRSLILFVREIPEYNFYLHEKEMRAFTNSYAAGLKYLLLNRFVLTGAYQSNEYQGPATVELGRPTRDMSRIFSAGFYYETARKTSIGLSLQSQKMSYEDAPTADGTIPLSQTLDREERSGALEIYYRVFSDSMAFLRGGVTTYTFANEAGASRDSTSYQGAAGIRFPQLGPLRGLLSIGYKELVPRSAGLARYAGVTANTELEGRFGWFNLRGIYQRDISFSYYEDAFAFLANRYAAGVSVYPLRALRLDYTYDVTLQDYPDVWSLVPTPHRRDTQTLHTVGLVVRLFRTTGFGVTANLSDWTSTVAGFNRKRSYIAAYVTQTF